MRNPVTVSAMFLSWGSRSRNEAWELGVEGLGFRVKLRVMFCGDVGIDGLQKKEIPNNGE